MKDPKTENKQEQEKDDWDLGTPQNTCNLKKKPDDECESCQ